MRLRTLMLTTGLAALLAGCGATTAASASRIPLTAPATPAPTDSVSTDLSAATPIPASDPAAERRATPEPVLPDGVPLSEVGALEVDMTGAQLYQDWTLGGPDDSDCTPGTGTITTAGNDVLLTTSGVLDSCTGLISPGSYTYGTFEAYVDLPAGPNGTVANWPSFWMTGADWPVDGEFDIMECQGGYQYVTFHYGADNSTASWEQPGIGPGWHVFTGVWGPGYIAVYIDGIRYVSWSSPDVTSEPMQVLFGNTTGPDGYTTGEPSTLTVGYLRIWEWK